MSESLNLSHLSESFELPAGCIGEEAHKGEIHLGLGIQDRCHLKKCQNKDISGSTKRTEVL